MVHLVNCINCNITRKNEENFIDVSLAIASNSEEELTHSLVCFNIFFFQQQ